MAMEARIRKGYRWKPGLVAVLFLGFGLLCIYDGYIAYPADNRRHERAEQFKEAHADWRERWPAFAAEHGMPENPKALEYHSQADIALQYLMAGFSLLVGGLAAWGWVYCGRMWIRCDEQGLAAHHVPRVRWDQITLMDKTRWKSKGIAVLHYEDETGRPGRITLDDVKYDTERTEQIRREVETRLRQIGGEALIRPPAEQSAPPPSEPAGPDGEESTA
jgi:hypothetical protein